MEGDLLPGNLAKDAPPMPSHRKLCADCGEPKAWMYLLVEGRIFGKPMAVLPEEAAWVSYCVNSACGSGPTILRSL